MINGEVYLSFNHLSGDIPEGVELFRSDVFSCIIEKPANISLTCGFIRDIDNSLLNERTFLYYKDTPIKNGIAIMSPEFTSGYKDNISRLHRFVSEYEKFADFFSVIANEIKEKFNYDISTPYGFNTLPIGIEDEEGSDLSQAGEPFVKVMSYIAKSFFKKFFVEKIYLLLSDDYFVIEKNTNISEFDIHKVQRELFDKYSYDLSYRGDSREMLGNTLCGIYIPITEGGYNLSLETQRELSIIHDIAEYDLVDVSLTFDGGMETHFYGIPYFEVNRLLKCKNIKDYMIENHEPEDTLLSIIDWS